MKSEVMPKKTTECFFNYLSKNFKWSLSGSCIDWHKVDNSVCINIDTFSFDEIVNEILKTPLKNYDYFCFSYNSGEDTKVYKNEDALENLDQLLIGPGDAYIYGAVKNSTSFEASFETFVEIYAGNWLCYIAN